MRPVAAYFVATAAALAVVVVVTALWIMHLRLGPPLGGWVAGPMLIFVPILLLIMTATWLIARPILGRWIDWRLGTVIGATAISAYLLLALACGPIACFLPGTNRAMGWFMVAGVALAAGTHHLVHSRLQQRARNGGQ